MKPCERSCPTLSVPLTPSSAGVAAAPHLAATAAKACCRNWGLDEAGPGFAQGCDRLVEFAVDVEIVQDELRLRVGKEAVAESHVLVDAALGLEDGEEALPIVLRPLQLIGGPPPAPPGSCGTNG